ncbi:MAG: sugar-binding transcriptional regulator [Candidatus Taylorbacteria bacterium]|nr:sugar-binding transcriptional regulator [Candidatus Taylorbacteria bacterium]
MINTDKEELLIRICRLYYEQNVSQDVIAKKFHLSRSYISKLLKEATQLGLVEIRIKDSLQGESELETSLRNRFGLKKAIIVPVVTQQFEKKLDAIGTTVGRFLHNILSDDDIIGISWGLTLAACAKRLIKKDLNNVKIIQLKGGLPHMEEFDRMNEIARLFVEAYKAEAHFLPLPLIVDSAEIKNAILQDRKIQSILKLGVDANIVLFAVGEFDVNSALVRSGYFSHEDVERLLAKGVVGDACGRLIDINGTIIAKEYDERTIGIPLSQLKNKEYSILIAAESKSVKGVYGALEAKYANVFIADEYTAKEIVKLDEKMRNSHGVNGE